MSAQIISIKRDNHPPGWRKPLDLAGDMFADHVSTPTLRIEIRHCGHRTAHYPYYLEGEDVKRMVTFSHKKQAERFVSAVFTHGWDKAEELCFGRLELL